MIAVSRKPHVSKQVLIRISLVVSGGRGAARDPAGKRSALLDGEAIEGEGSREQGAGEGQVARPVAPELRRERENEIERDVVEPRGPERPHGLADARRVVSAMHPLQDLVVEGLGAQ